MDGIYYTHERDFFYSRTNNCLFSVQYLVNDVEYKTTSEDTEYLILGHEEPSKEIRYLYTSDFHGEVSYSVIEQTTSTCITSASGVNAKKITVGGGGSANGCTCDVMTVSASAFYSSKSTMNDDGVFNETIYFDRKTTYGLATGCTVNSEMTVDNGGSATNCTVNGRLLVNGKNDGQNASAANCVVNGTLEVRLGGDVSFIEVRQGDAFIGAPATWNNESYQDGYSSDGPAVATNITVTQGDMTVRRGGRLVGAEINGALIAEKGATLSGNITCTSLQLGDLDTAAGAYITVKVDLNDYAIPVKSTTTTDGTTRTETKYYADFHKTVTTYVLVDNSWVRSDTIRVTFDPQKEGLGDTSTWRNRFEVNLGTIGNYASTGGSPITLDFGDSLSNFDEGTITLSGNLSGNAAPVKFKTNQEQFELILDENDEGIFDGFTYNSDIYGYGYEVLWLEQGVGDGVEYVIDLPQDYMNGVSENISIRARDDNGKIKDDIVIPPDALKNNALTLDSAASNDLVIVGEESNGRQHQCDLELWVVPEVIPGLDKATTGKFSDLLKQAQGNMCSISCTWNNIHTTLLGVSLDLTKMGVNFTVTQEREATLKMQGKLEWAISDEEAGTGKNTKLVLDLSGDSYIAIRCPWKQNAILDVVGSMICPDFKIGAFKFSNVSVSINTTSNSWKVSTYVTLPGISYAIGGEIGVVDGYWDSMAIGVDNLNVPLGTTGLMLQKVSGKIQDMATSLDMTFGGSLGLTFGPKVKVTFADWLGIDSGTYSLCELNVSGEISTAGELTGSASLSVLSGLMTGSGTVSSNSSGFSLNGEFSMLNGCISVKGDFSASGGNVTISGTGTMAMPSEDIFGLLGGMSLSANVEADFGARYVVAWHESQMFGNTFSVGVRSTFDGEVELLGVSSLQVFQNLKKSPAMALRAAPSVKRQYEVTGGGMALFCCSVSSGMLDVELKDGSGKVYNWSGIQSNAYDNIQIVNDLSTSNHVVVAVNKPAEGVWTVSSANSTATLSANLVNASELDPEITSVTLGEKGRSAVLKYSLGKIDSLENLTLSIYCDKGGTDSQKGLCLAKFTPTAATGSYEWVLDNEADGGDYAFRLLVEADGIAPVQSESTDRYTFAVPDTEAPDAIMASNAVRTDTGTTVTWAVPYDNVGIAGYMFRYGTDAKNLTGIRLAKNEFTFRGLPNGVYFYQMAAVDAAGNMAEWQPLQECLVNLLDNASRKNCTVGEDLTLDDYSAAWKITAGVGIAITVENGSLIADSTVSNIEIEGIAERMTINGTALLGEDGQLMTATVKGYLTVGEGGAASDITVNGTMAVENGGTAEGVDVVAGAVLALGQGARFSDISMEYGSVLNIVKSDGYSTGKFMLTDDIHTAGTANFARNVYGNGYKIYFDEYKQTSEQVKGSNGVTRDSVALVNDMSKVVGNSMAVVIDSSVEGRYKIADKATGFDGTIIVLDKTENAEIKVGLDEFSLVGDGACKLYLDGEALWMMVSEPTMTPPSFTVDVDVFTDYDYIGIDFTPVFGENYKLRYSLNADMSNAIVIDGMNAYNGFILEKDNLLPDTNYYLQMSRGNSYGLWSKWSDTVVINAPAPETPAITVARYDKKKWDNVTVTVADCSYAQGYTFRYADNPEMTNAITVNTDKRTKTISIEKSSLKYGRTYYVQALAQHACDSWSQWSEVTAFEYKNQPDYVNITVTADENQYFSPYEDETINTVTVSNGGYCYLRSVATNVTVNNGGFVRTDGGCDVFGITVNSNGRLWLNEGKTENLTVNDGGYVRLMHGALTDAVIRKGGQIEADYQDRNSLLNGTITIQGYLFLNSPIVGSNANYVLDIGSHEDDKTQKYISSFRALIGENTYTLQLDATPEIGLYSLGFNSYNDPMTFTLLDGNGTKIGDLAYNGAAILYNGIYYNVIGDDGLACLNIGNEPAKPRSRIADASMKVSGNRLSWGSTNPDGFVLEFFGKDSSLMVNVDEPEVSLYNLPGDVSGWRVREADEEYWTSTQTLTGSSHSEPKVIRAASDYVEDVLFAQPCGIWEDNYFARHVGFIDGWLGTDETMEIKGMNRFADVFMGNCDDSNKLLLTNGNDAFFMDDIFTAFPNSEQRGRFEKINEIFAGDGNDLVDMTGKHFNYAANESMIIHGGKGDDTIWGGPGICVLYGDEGNDRLVGSQSGDDFYGGPGDDVMIGGGGYDVFHFEDNWGKDTIILCSGNDAILQFAEGISGTWDEAAMKYTCGSNMVQIVCKDDYVPYVYISAAG